jgi:ketosteroid isomerase-like protein
MLTRLSVDEVQAEVRRFWSAFSGKSPEGLKGFYAGESSVFGSSSTRSEPGSLAAARRQREYFTPQTVIKAQLGPIDVVMLGESAAVASYTFTFHATKVANLLGKAAEEDIQHGRATQVFSRDAEGKLRIVHEHLSTVDHVKA